MHVALAWVWVALIAGVLIGGFVAAAYGGRRLAEQRRMADQWRDEAVRSASNLDDLLAFVARVSGAPRAAGTREEMARMLRSMPEGRPVEPCPAAPVGGVSWDQERQKAQAADHWPEYIETAAERDAQEEPAG